MTKQRYFIRKTPESQGLHSIDVIRFLEAAQAGGCKLHTCMVLRHGMVIAEGYQHPYTAAHKRLLHSVSKTVTALAVGFAVQEGKLNIDDPVLSFFPEHRIGEARLKRMTVEHLLTMSTGHGEDTIFELYDEDDWIGQFLAREMSYEPGAKFQYDSGATFMLSAIITRLYGQPMKEVLASRLFAPLQITDYEWDSHGGMSTGGWGLMLKPEDMAKLAMLFLHRGKVGNRRILAESWFDQAAVKQVETPVGEAREDWGMGYGYQMWRGRGNTHRADGAFGQFFIIAPDQDMVVVITSEDATSQTMLDCVYTYLFRQAKPGVLPENAVTYPKLREKLHQMEGPEIFPASVSWMEHRISDQEYRIQKGTGEKRLQFKFQGSRLQVHVDGNTWITSSAVMYRYGTAAALFRLASFIGLNDLKGRSWQYAARHEWISESVLRLHLYYTETAHSQEILFLFSNENITMQITDSYKKMLQISHTPASAAVVLEDEVYHGEVI